MNKEQREGEKERARGSRQEGKQVTKAPANGQLAFSSRIFCVPGV